MKPHYSLDDLRYFCIIAQLSSFKKASENLNLPLSTLSRRIRQLESDLGLRLLNRDAHRVTLTHIGDQYYQRYHQVFEQVNTIDLDLREEKTQAKGKIRIAAPIYLGKNVLSAIFCDFLLVYPEIQLDLHFSNDLIDAEGQGIDIVFRVRNSTIENWVARQLKVTRNILCCDANASLEHIADPEQLNALPKVRCVGLTPWQLDNQKTNQVLNYQPIHAVRVDVDEIQVMLDAVKAGVGISYIPDYIALPLIEAGEVKRILTDWESQNQAVSMFYRDRKSIPLRVRLLIEYVLKRFNL